MRQQKDLQADRYSLAVQLEVLFVVSGVATFIGGFILIMRGAMFNDTLFVILGVICLLAAIGLIGASAMFRMVLDATRAVRRLVELQEGMSGLKIEPEPEPQPPPPPPPPKPAIPATVPCRQCGASLRIPTGEYPSGKPIGRCPKCGATAYLTEKTAQKK